MQTTYPMTKFGHAKLSEELNYLKNEERPQVIKAIEEAADLGDLSDVTISSIASGEILKWDGSKWVAGSPGGATINKGDYASITDDGVYLCQPEVDKTITVDLSISQVTLVLSLLPRCEPPTYTVPWAVSFRGNLQLPRLFRVERMKYRQNKHAGE